MPERQSFTFFKRLLIVLAVSFSSLTGYCALDLTTLGLDFDLKNIKSGEFYYDLDTFHRFARVSRRYLPLSSYSDEITIPDYISWGNIRYTVMAIGERAFQGGSITSIKGPSKLTIIYEGAFEDCNNLKTVDLGNVLKYIDANAFAGCSNLSNIELPATVISIASKAFYNCKSITSITIPQAARVLDGDIFIGCTRLSDLQLSEENDYFSLEHGILYDGDKSTAILINPWMAVRNANWTDFSLPPSLRRIGPYSFYGLCMDNLTIPGSVNKIGDYAFYSGRFDSVNLENGSGEIEISTNAFEKAEFIELTLDRNITESGELTSGPFTGMQKLKKVIAGNNVTKINDMSFWKCSVLTEVQIGNNLNEIGKSAFGQCEFLQKFDFGTSVEYIDDYAFEGSWRLKDIVLPASLKRIGKDVLQRGNGFIAGTITCFAPKAPSAVDAFKSLNKETWTIKIPIGSLESYKAIPDWKYFNAIYEVRPDGTFPVAESIHINAPASSHIKIGETVKLSVTILPENAHDKSVTWKSSDTSIVTVVNGTITGLKEGVAVITATDAEGHSDSIEITVEVALVEKIELTPSNLILDEGQEQTIIATIIPALATEKKLAWSSLNPEIAKVDENGKVLAWAVGETEIQAHATDGSGIMASCHVKVHPRKEVESIRIDYKGNTVIYVGDKIQLKATVTPANASDKSIKWSSSNPEILTIDQDGNATALAEGKAIITATSSNGLTATLTIKVTPILVNRVCFQVENQTLAIGETLQLVAQVYPENATDKSVIWQSDNPEVLSVSDTGLLTALKDGTAKITLSAVRGNCYDYTVEFTVKPILVQRVNISFEGSSTLALGEVKQLTATIWPEDASYKDIKWQTMHPNILTVSETGLITAVGPGECTINAISHNGVRGSKSFNVTSSPASVEKVLIDAQSPMEMFINETKTFEVRTTPMAVAPSTLTWYSSRPNVASFTDGVLTAHKTGTTTISVTSGNGVISNLITIEVKDIPIEGITILAPQNNIPVGEYMSLEAVVIPAEASYQTLSWESSNPQIIDVDKDGRIHAKDEGTVTVTATAPNQIAGSIQITAYRILAETVQLEKHEMTLEYAETYILNASIFPTNVSCKNLDWRSSDPAIVAVDKGQLTAWAVGQCTITVTTKDGTNLSDNCIVRVPQYVEYISLNENNLNLTEGSTYTLIATIHPNNAEDTSIEWSSSDPEYVTVDQNGLVRAIKEGSATITAASGSSQDIFAICNVNVRKGEPVEDQHLTYDWLKETETSLSNGWSIENILLPNQSSYIWKWKNTNGKYYLAGSSYISGKSYKSEAIVYSPVIDLMGCSSASFSFEHAAKYQTSLKDCCRIIIRQVGGQWEEIIPNQWPTAGTWNFTTSGNVDLSNYLGKRIQIGFKYGSTEMGADTWEIKNVHLEAKKALGASNVVINDEELTVKIIGNIILAPEGSRIFDVNGREVYTKHLISGVYFVHNPRFSKVLKVYIK